MPWRVEANWWAVERARLQAEQNHEFLDSVPRDPKGTDEANEEARIERDEARQDKEDLEFQQDINERQLELHLRRSPSRQDVLNDLRLQEELKNRPVTPETDPDLYQHAPESPNDTFPMWITDGSPETEPHTQGSLASADNYLRYTQDGGYLMDSAQTPDVALNADATDAPAAYVASNNMYGANNDVYDADNVGDSNVVYDAGNGGGNNVVHASNVSDNNDGYAGSVSVPPH